MSFRAAALLLFLITLPLAPLYAQGKADAPAAQGGDITGQWAVTGWNPGNTGGAADYRGGVMVEPRGGVYHVAWQIGSQRFVGTGILTGATLSVAYNGGIAVYSFEGNGMAGIWATTDGTQLGREDWTR